MNNNFFPGNSRLDLQGSRTWGGISLEWELREVGGVGEGVMSCHSI